jgi:hypothetical protein
MRNPWKTRQLSLDVVEKGLGTRVIKRAYEEDNIVPLPEWPQINEKGLQKEIIVIIIVMVVSIIGIFLVASLY